MLEKSKRNPLSYSSFYNHFWNLFVLSSRNSNAIDIETKQTKASIMGKFLY
jgi:hypothetical protein